MVQNRNLRVWQRLKKNRRDKVKKKQQRQKLHKDNLIETMIVNQMDYKIKSVFPDKEKRDNYIDNLIKELQC